MDARAKTGRNRLERIAALLLSLAGLAEHAATRSAPVRLVVLWLLRRAEDVAADFLAASAPRATVWQDRLEPDGSGNSPADALALALSLRLLALGVQAMAAEADRILRAQAFASAASFMGTRLVGLRVRLRRLLEAAAALPEPRDTS